MQADKVMSVLPCSIGRLPVVGVARQTPRVTVEIRRTALAKRPLGRRELNTLTDWDDC